MNQIIGKRATFGGRTELNRAIALFAEYTVYEKLVVAWGYYENGRFIRESNTIKQCKYSEEDLIMLFRDDKYERLSTHVQFWNDNVFINEVEMKTIYDAIRNPF